MIRFYSIKPFILLLWVGSFVATMGLVIATVYRARLAVRRVVKSKQGDKTGSRDQKQRVAA